MGLFSKKKEKSGAKCPACGSFKISPVRGTQAVMSYPGFYSGISNNPDNSKVIMCRCNDCKNIFQAEN